MILPACSHERCRAADRWRMQSADFKTADLQPIGWVCGLEISDPQTDRKMTERVCSVCRVRRQYAFDLKTALLNIYMEFVPAS